MKEKIVQQISLDEAAYINKLNKIVQDTITEEDLIINNLLHPPAETLSRGKKISDLVAQFGGSWRFIIVFVTLMIIWIVYNVTALTSKAFDPYPFILLNLLLSCVAALQAPIIMMSQNRKEEKDRMRAENDYLINLKAEIGIRSLHQKMDLLLAEQIKTLYDIQKKQLVLLEQIQASLKK